MAGPSHTLLLVFATVASITISVSAQEYYPEHGGQFPPHFIDETKTKYSSKLAGIDFSKNGIDTELFQNLDKRGALPPGLGSNPAGDIRDWLLHQAQNYKMKGHLDGFDDTPLGDISLDCYNDLSTFLNDAQAFKTYALKMYSSWGENTNWFKALYTSTGKSYGAYELCAGVTEGKDDSPFDAQYCVMHRPIVELLFVDIQAEIGSCWPSTCSAKELETAHREYLGLIGQLADISYDCLVDVPWTGGAIATLCILAFFGLIVLIGSIYHVTLHNYVTSAIKSLTEASYLQATKHTYEQIVKDDNEKTFPIYWLYASSSRKEENGVEEGKSNSEYKNGGGQEKTESSAMTDSKSNGMTKLVIEDGNVGHGPLTGTSHVKLAVIDRLLMSFSVFQNTEKIFSTGMSSSPLAALNGIRVLSMWWVILGHSNQFLVYSRLDNGGYIAVEIIRKVWFKVITYGSFSVDTFFVLSGLLVTYLTLKQLAKTNGKINWFLFYFHRYWRITPVFVVTFAIWVTLFPYLGKGAGKNAYSTMISTACADLWWSDLLYINNLYPFPGNLNKGCMSWSWYLSNDMQFFIISPIIIYMLWKYWKWGFGLIASLCLISFGSTAYLTWYWGLGFNGGGGAYNNRTSTTPGIEPSDDFIYAKPYCRIPTFLVGMILGYIFFKLKGRTFKMSKLVNLTGWALSTAIACSVIYGVQATTSGPLSPQWLAMVYTAVSRFAFSVSVGWVIFACVSGNGGYINSFLSWSVWVPLGRLSFAAYLVHPVIMFLVIYTKKTTFHWTYVEISYFFIGNVVASYACAFVLAVLVEGPTVGMEKALIGRPASPKKEKIAD